MRQNKAEGEQGGVFRELDGTVGDFRKLNDGEGAWGRERGEEWVNWLPFSNHNEAGVS